MTTDYKDLTNCRRTRVLRSQRNFVTAFFVGEVVQDCAARDRELGYGFGSIDCFFVCADAQKSEFSQRADDQFFSGEPCERFGMV